MQTYEKISVVKEPKRNSQMPKFLSKRITVHCSALVKLSSHSQQNFTDHYGELRFSVFPFAPIL